MKKARVSIIAALGKNRELGKAGDLIWRIPGDLRYVKDITMGHPLIMGRKTYESIGRPLPGRTMIVISGSSASIEGCTVCPTLQDALSYAETVDTEEIFIFGGARVYEEALAYTHRLYVTLIDAEDSEADTFFPDYSTFTKIIEKKDGGVFEYHGNNIRYTHHILEK